MRSAALLMAALLVMPGGNPIDATGLPTRYDDPDNQLIDIHMSPRLRPGGLHLSYDAASRDEQSLLDVAGLLAADGKAIYHRDWSADRERRLGPDFDATRCAACHVETSPLADDWDASPVFVVKAGDSDARRVYGEQVNTRHVAERLPEGRVTLRYDAREFIYADGSVVELRQPRAFAVGRQGETFEVELRIAPLLFGWGLLEQASPDFLSSFDDPDDANRDGISGRLLRDAQGRIARFGWKSSHVSLVDQVAAALHNDMGIDSGARCAHCDEEISDGELAALVDYVRFLGVPDRRPGATQRGQDLFGVVGCSDCHVSVSLTGEHDDATFSRQVAWPFSNLAVHDMGADLASPSGAADAREWRTAPLWGLGVVEQRFPERGFLHDGRARTIEEAILWHGGESRTARDRFSRLDLEDRQALLRYVRSL